MSRNSRRRPLSYYAHPKTPLGAVQRGLGSGLYRLTGRPDGQDVVRQCVVHDYRWDWQVDERAVYLARLVRAVDLPVSTLLTLLRTNPTDDDNNTFDNTLQTLGALGRAGDPEAIDGLRRHVADGPRGVDVLEHITREWPSDHWADLQPTAQARRTVSGRPSDSGTHTASRRPRPLRETSTDKLLADVVDGDHARQRAALNELNSRGPQPALLPLLDRLPVDDLRIPLGRSLDLLGAEAVPVARRWSATVGHPMRWRAYTMLARHGDDTDAPALITAWDWLDSRPDDRCGYDDLAAGLARIGGPTAQSAVPRLRRLWHSPHSFERAGYLRALVILDPDHVHPRLAEGLWDCEADVREFAAEHVPLDPEANARLDFLATDPMETDEVRSAAATRRRAV